MTGMMTSEKSGAHLSSSAKIATSNTFHVISLKCPKDWIAVGGDLHGFSK